MKTGTFEDFIASLSDKSGKKVILYIERDYNRLVNKYLTANYMRLREVMARSGNEFVYLPEWLNNEDLLEGVDYFVPNVPEEDRHQLIKELYLHVNFAYHIGVSGACFVRFSSDGKTVEYSYPLNEKLLNLNRLLDIEEESVLFRVTDNVLKDYPASDYFLPSVELANQRVEEMESLLENAEASEEMMVAEGDDIDPEVLVLSHEIAEKIQRLKAIGGLNFVVSLFKAHLQSTTKISRLYVDAEYRIFLTDYGNREIKLPPLAKIVYLLFLNHPEGLKFKHLSDYRHELLHLYKNISSRMDVDQLVMNVNRLIDPFDNSLNEKVSVIRLRFISEMDESLVKPYLISGEKGERRYIAVDRSLVSYSQALRKSNSE